MAYATLGTGLWFPKAGQMGTAIATNIMDATAERVALLGYCYIDGRAASKTISAAGGGSISFRLGTTTFANGASTLDIGIQDMSASSPQQPDGTFDVKVTLTGSGLTTAAWNTISMTGGTGSKTIAHGDLIAIVFDFTNRAGADSVIVSMNATNNGWAMGQAASQQGLPGSNIFLAGAWATGSASSLPNAVITFDDGTIGMLDGGYPVTPSDAAFNNPLSPDEYCEIFQVPFNCKVDALFAAQGGSSATTSDFDANLYSDPTGTPTSIMPGAVAKSVLAEQFAQAGSQASYAIIPLTSEVSLSANTDYAVALKATGAGNLNLKGYTIPTAGCRAFLPGGTTLQSASRNDSAGAFASASTTQHYILAVRISSIDLGSEAAAESTSSVNVVQANVGVLTNTIGY